MEILINYDKLQHLAPHSQNLPHLVSEERQDPTVPHICWPVSLATVNKLTQPKHCGPGTLIHS